MKNIVDLIKYISAFSVIIPLLFYVGYFFKNNQRPRSSHIIGIFVVISALTDIVVLTFISKNISTASLVNLYYVLFFFLTVCFYYELFIKRNTNTNYRIALVTGIFIYCSCFIVTLLNQGFFTHQSPLWTFSGLIIIAYSIAFFYYLFQSGPASSPHLRHSAWFAGGFIFYFAISTSIFVLFQYLLSETTPDVMRTLWSVHNVGNIVKNIAFAIGLYYTGINK